jgi:ubiquinone/menaquinone biosynthesis C-methylase UbiE
MNPKQITRLFGRFSQDYDSHMRKTNHLRVQHEILDSFLPFIRGKTLDIATGTGTVAKYLKEKTNCEIFAIDLSPGMIQKARENSGGIDFQVADAQNIPFPDNSFNIVTCSYGFYWFYDRSKIISELKRVLKPNGILILLEEESKPGFEPKPRFASKANYLSELAKLENYVGTERLKAELERSGFRLLATKKIPIDGIHGTTGMVFSKAALYIHH